MNWRAIMRGEATELYSHNSQNPQNLTDAQNIANIENIAKRVERWNPELASEGYVWCLDCQHFNGVNCNHIDNPFHTVEKQPLAPRKCQWFESSILIY